MIRVGGVSLILDEEALNALVNSKDGPVAKELGRIGARIEGRAKQLLSGELVNVGDTGLLRSTTTWRLFERGRRLGVAVGSGTNYAVFVHDGTRFLDARPYLTIAARDILGKSII